MQPEQTVEVRVSSRLGLAKGLSLAGPSVLSILRMTTLATPKEILVYFIGFLRVAVASPLRGNRIPLRDVRRSLFSRGVQVDRSPSGAALAGAYVSSNPVLAIQIDDGTDG